MVVPRGGYAYLGENIKNAVRHTKTLVSMANRINTPQLAESILQQEKVDIIALGRALITDPEFLIKTREGRFDEIRKCLACNQGCFDAVFSASAIACTVNAQVGFEEKRKITLADQKKKVIVIGGGPAGLEAARVCKLRGHDVTLYEKSKRLGGALHLAGAPPGRKEFFELVKWYENEMKRLGINVVLNSKVDASTLEGENPDAIVVANGSIPIELNIPGMKKDDPRIMHAYDVLEGRKHAGKRVVIIGGSGVGLDVGLYLAEEGGLNPEQAMFLMKWKALSPEDALQLALRTREIKVVEMLKSLGQGIGQTTRWTILKDLAMSGVEMITKAKAMEITNKPFGVLVDKEGKQEFLEADTIVMAVGVKPDKALFDDLKANLPNVKLYKAGDAKKARTALEAVAEGLKTAIKI